MESRSAFRVISWNIARGSKLEGILEFLAAANADIIFLQEADKSARRTGYRNIAKEIAQKLRLNYVFGCEFEELAQGSTSSLVYSPSPVPAEKTRGPHGVVQPSAHAGQKRGDVQPAS
jgi:endonuclease/exonuclease/phosphatase family metal-dependent hydrolase